MTQNSDSLFDAQPISAKQVLVVAVVMLVMIIDGMDTQLLALAAPQIARGWGLGKAAFAPILTAAMVGIILGAVAGGWAGDRLGRRNLLIGSTMLFGLATVASGLAQTTIALLGLRFVSGLGFGAALPNAHALGLEWLPPRSRPRVAALLPAASPIGGTIAATISLWLLPAYGWRALFLGCGATSILLGVVLAVWLPESPLYLIRRGRSKKAAALINRIARYDRAEADRIVDTFTTRATGPRSTDSSSVDTDSARRLLLVDYRRLLIGSCLGLFAFGGVSQTFFNWLPLMLTTAGLPTQDAIRGSQFFNLFGISSVVVGPLLVVYLGTRATMLACVVVGEVLLLTIALSIGGPPVHQSSFGLLFTIGMTGAIVSTGIAATYAMMGSSYPNPIRATGIGIAATCLRIGGVVAITGGGYLFALLPDTSTPGLALAGLLLAGAAIAAVVNDRHVKRTIISAGRPARV